ncbi:polysaccharide lyase family 8 protein [Thelephora ganbajun]|uniref:Polysaccharide lyase family 8 protein n=1 Tax=Thelephora ganbajun TaxID=370292 RepID=A0ACB6ZGX1_THEGA|nr:polysaccharide lyase family 8 protein [Thelephora ganbajun]
MLSLKQLVLYAPLALYNFSVLVTGQSSSSTSSSSSPFPTGDIKIILERGFTYTARAQADVSHIPTWIQTLSTEGMWPASEVDLTTGCDARRANWPAQRHWSRILTMASAYHGGIPIPDGDKYVKDPVVLDALGRAMDYWFAHDYTNDACLEYGGHSQCPCGTPGLWNTNWYSNIILIPGFVGKVCNLVHEELSTVQLENCNRMLARTYGTFDRFVGGVGYLTGANTLGVASIALDYGLLNNNATIVFDAYRRLHNEVVIVDKIRGDGIRRDGSFGQHSGVIYNGNYGKDFLNANLEFESKAAGTKYAAGAGPEGAFELLVGGDAWIIYRNTKTGVLHWDFSVEGRFISFPVVDGQATASINFNITELIELGHLWNSDTLINVGNSLNTSSNDANVGDIRGNKMFYTNDYMIHRGPGYVSTLKMYSNRTKNTECLNSQNVYGFHLSDGTLYTYLAGDEYEDIAASWDWNLIPGITTDYGGTTLRCNLTESVGIQAFVGGVSDGEVGAAVMRYTNPVTGSITFQKAWFFLDDDVQVVMLSDVTSNSSSPIISVLDQKKHVGSYYVDGDEIEPSSAKRDGATRRLRSHGLGHNHHTRQKAFAALPTVNVTRHPGIQSLWHANVGYSFDLGSPVSVSVQTGNKTGNWSALGISTQPPSNVDMFAAWIEQSEEQCSLVYKIFPAMDRASFQRKALRHQSHHWVLINDKTTSAILDTREDTAFVIFWDANGGSVTVPRLSGFADVTVSSNTNSAIIYHRSTGEVVVSDPSQTASTLVLDLEAGIIGERPPGFEAEPQRELIFSLPSGGLAGSSVSQSL